MATSLKLTANPSTLQIPTPGATNQSSLSVTQYDQYGAVMTASGVSYALNSPYNGVTVNASTGIVTIASDAQPGTVTLKATCNGLTATVQLILTAPPLVATSIKLTSDTDALQIPVADTTAQAILSAKIYDQNGAVMPNSGTVYSLSTPYTGVLVNSATGVVTVTPDAQPGIVTLEAFCSGLIATTELILLPMQSDEDALLIDFMSNLIPENANSWEEVDVELIDEYDFFTYSGCIYMPHTEEWFAFTSESGAYIDTTFECDNPNIQFKLYDSSLRVLSDVKGHWRVEPGQINYIKVSGNTTNIAIYKLVVENVIIEGNDDEEDPIKTETEQVLGVEAFDESIFEDNSAAPNLTINVAGTASRYANISETDSNISFDSTAMIGKSITVDLDEYVTSGIISFTLDAPRPPNEIIICHYDFEKMVMTPLDTKSSSNTVYYANLVGQGDYFVLDIKEFFECMGMDADNPDEYIITEDENGDIIEEDYIEATSVLTEQSAIAANMAFAQTMLDQPEDEAKTLEDSINPVDFSPEQILLMSENSGLSQSQTVFGIEQQAMSIQPSILTNSGTDVMIAVLTTKSLKSKKNTVINQLKTLVDKLSASNPDIRYYVNEYHSGGGATTFCDWTNNANTVKNALDSLYWLSTDNNGLPNRSINSLDNFFNDSSREKHVIFVTDMDYRKDADYLTSKDAIDNCDINNIALTTLVTNPNLYSKYYNVQKTGGIAFDLRKSFVDTVYNVIAKPIQKPTGSQIIRLKNGKLVKLDRYPSFLDEVTDTDGDGLPDSKELVRSKKISVIDATKLLKRYKENIVLPASKKVYVPVFDYYSDPTMVDTSGDGFPDNVAQYPRVPYKNPVVFIPDKKLSEFGMNDSLKPKYSGGGMIYSNAASDLKSLKYKPGVNVFAYTRAVKTLSGLESYIIDTVYPNIELPMKDEYKANAYYLSLARKVDLLANGSGIAVAHEYSDVNANNVNRVFLFHSKRSTPEIVNEISSNCSQNHPNSNYYIFSKAQMKYSRSQFKTFFNGKPLNFKTTELDINPKSVSIDIGDSINISAAAYPDFARDKQLTWKSSNTMIATVNSNGVVTAIAEGKATITCTNMDGRKSLKCEVTVAASFDWLFEVLGVALQPIGESLQEEKDLALGLVVSISKNLLDSGTITGATVLSFLDSTHINRDMYWSMYSSYNYDIQLLLNYIEQNFVVYLDSYYAGRLIGDIADILIGTYGVSKGLMLFKSGLVTVGSGLLAFETGPGGLGLVLVGVGEALAGGALVVASAPLVYCSAINFSDNLRKYNKAIEANGSPKGLIGKDFEDWLTKKFGGNGSFSVGGREFDGGNGNRWWEAKSGQYWDMLEAEPSELLKFKSDMGDRLNIAKQNGATYELFSNTPIPQSIKDWLTTKGITYTEILY